jgi:FkbM family methyltransferase
MLDALPSLLRSPLWKLKHAMFSIAHRHELVEYMQAELGVQLRRNAIDLVLDVGANVGQFGRSLRRIGYQGDIVSFEPIPDNVQTLKRSTQGDAGWTIQQFALGETDGSDTLRVTRDTAFSSLRTPSTYAQENFAAGAAVDAEITVNVRRLDRLLPALLPAYQERKVHLKIDTQGTDLLVLRGARDILPQVASLQIEVGLMPLYEEHTPYASVLAEVSAMGFALTGFFPVARDTRGRVVDADCLFRRELA